MVVPPPSPQQLEQFLTSVLTQRRPSDVPYAEDSKWLIRHHLLSLFSAYPSLDIRTAPFTHTDGRTIILLQADGTIPMAFRGVIYNIPVIIWLLESYPRYAPCVYVNPTRDMIVKRPHPNVTPSGMVSVPYLQNWIYPSSNLVDLVGELRAAFSRDPPLYSQRRPPPTSDPLNPYGSVGCTRPPLTQHPPPPRPYPPPPYGVEGRMQHMSTQQHGPQIAVGDAAQDFRRTLMNEIMEKVAGDAEKMRREREIEAEGFLRAQMVLRQREDEMNKGLKEMDDEKEALERQLQVVLMNSDILEAWIKENEGKKYDLNNFDVENAFEYVDLLSKQMLECMARDLAIEDVIYWLDKGLQEGVILVDQYLRNVRLLSREQFFHRAVAAKVRAAQMQAQVVRMAAKLYS